MLFYANYKKINFDGEKNIRWIKQHLLHITNTSVSDFVKKSQCTYVSAAKLHLNYRKKTIFSDICLVFLLLFVFLQLLCELMKYTSVGLFCFEVYIYIKHYELYNFGLHEWYGLFEICIKFESEP